MISLGLGVAFGVRTFLLAHYRVLGSSMAETLHTGDRVFVNRLSYSVGDPSRGDVVVLHKTRTDGDLIKRVIGLPGETIEIVGCQVYVDNRRLEEPYLEPLEGGDEGWCSFGPMRIPPGMFFVLGDNRGGSSDSRSFGPVPEEEIVGRAFAVFWPLSELAWL